VVLLTGSGDILPFSGSGDLLPPPELPLDELHCRSITGVPKGDRSRLPSLEGARRFEGELPPLRGVLGADWAAAPSAEEEALFFVGELPWDISPFDFLRARRLGAGFFSTTSHSNLMTSTKRNLRSSV